VSAESVALDGIDGAAAVLAWDGGARISVRTALPGLYNVYNLLAAGAAAAELGASAEAIAAGIAAFVPAFGRAERLAWNGVQIRILLGKNPAGFNELLRAVEAKPPAALLVAINDRTADGTDVSWLWDVDFEALRALAAPITVAGTRAHDMALRLKYAGLPEARVRVAPELPGALRAAAADAGGGTLVALPTYTAMLELRETLRALGVARGFWED
jgi:UDP-N-acetylmuramyl tripeptide synthase